MQEAIGMDEWLRKGESALKKAWRIIIGITFVIYCYAVLHIVLLSRVYLLKYGWGRNTILEYLSFQSNFVPFRTIGEYIMALRDGSMNRTVPVQNLLGNLLLFAPMGVYLPLLFSGLHSFRKAMLTTLGLLLGIELLQMFTRLGSFDIDDLILNMAGAMLGYGAYFICERFLFSGQKRHGSDLSDLKG